VAAWSEAWTIFVRSNIGVVGSNPTQYMDVYVYSVCIGSDLATGWSLVQRVLPTLLGLRNWSETKRLTDVLYSKVGATGKRETEIPYTLNWDHGKEYRGWISSTTPSSYASPSRTLSHIPFQSSSLCAQSNVRSDTVSVYFASDKRFAVTHLARGVWQGIERNNPLASSPPPSVGLPSRPPVHIECSLCRLVRRPEHLNTMVSPGKLKVIHSVITWSVSQSVLRHRVL
jgi:hypothetical protein